MTITALPHVAMDDDSFEGRLGDIAPELFGISIGFENITPETAQNLLDINTNNRRLNPRETKKLADEILGDNWTINGETIKVSRTNVLLDGQHRLAAVVETGRPIWTAVVRGLPDAAMSTIDTGRSRPMSQIVSLAGFSNANHRSAVARIVMAFNAGRTSTHGVNISPTDMLTYLHDEPLDAAVAMVAAATAARTPGSSTVLAAAWHICAQLDRESADIFFVEQVMNTIGLTAMSPARALRSRLASFQENSTTAKADQLRFMFAAWNAFRGGRGVSHLQSPRGGWTESNAPTPR